MDGGKTPIQAAMQASVRACMVALILLEGASAFTPQPGAALVHRPTTGPRGVCRVDGSATSSRAAKTTGALRMGWFDKVLGSPGSPSSEAPLPPGWSTELDPASGQEYFYNSQTGETTWDRPASDTPQPRVQAVQKAATTRVPRSYEEIHQEAIAGVLAGLDAGVSRLEVEFPPIAQTNKISDGSASSQAMVRRANVEFNVKVAGALAARGRQQRVVVLCGDSLTLQAMSQAQLPALAVCALVKDAEGVGITSSDVVMTCQPADAQAWMAVAKLAAQAPVVVLNGFQYNGYKAFEMAYYLKPMTFNSGICGYCIRRYPEDWVVWSAKTAAPLDYQVSFVEAQGCLRPDLQRISLALTA